MEHVLRAIRSLRTPAVMSEEKMGAALEARLREKQIAYQREAVLSPGCRIDFLLADGTGIEIKKEKPNAKQVMRQLERYAASESIHALILVSQRGVALPETCGGKPLTVLALQSCWGVTV